MKELSIKGNTPININKDKTYAEWMIKDPIEVDNNVSNEYNSFHAKQILVRSKTDVQLIVKKLLNKQGGRNLSPPAGFAY